MKDIRGDEIIIGDLLLNLRSPAIDPWDCWALLIAVPDYGKGVVIRDFNAWNLGWDSEETLIIGPYTDYPELLKRHGNETVDSVTNKIIKATL